MSKDQLRQPAGTPIGGQYASDPNASNAAPVDLGYDAVPETQDWGSVNLSVGSRTPWGKAQHLNKKAPGIVFVHTASHGGVKLSAERNQAVPPALRNGDGWYEEDLEAYKVYWAFPEDTLPPGMDVEQWKQETSRMLRDWLPDEWEQASGEAVTAEQSYIRAEQEFREAHKNDHVVISAIMSEESPGMVEVIATLGGSSSHDSGRPGQWGEDHPNDARKFLVPKDEYSAKRFAVDRARHQEITPKSVTIVPAQRHTHQIDWQEIYSDDDGKKSQARERIYMDLKKRWRDDNGRVFNLGQLIEGEGVTGISRHFSNGRHEYMVRVKEYENEGSSYTAYPVSKATYDYLSNHIPSDMSAKDVAREEYRAALWKLRKAEDNHRKTRRLLGLSNKERSDIEARLTRAQAAFEKARSVLDGFDDDNRG